jgi:acyl dehydratase
MTPRVLTLDEIKNMVGQEVGVSEWLRIEQDDIRRFADLTHDQQWIHVDEERARRESPFHATIAHGFFTLSLLSYFAQQIVQVRGDSQMTINYGLNRLRFVSPVPAGSRVRGRMAVQEIGEKQIIWKATVEIEGRDKPALVAEWITRYY